jgi:hypothetical protein
MSNIEVTPEMVREYAKVLGIITKGAPLPFSVIEPLGNQLRAALVVSARAAPAPPAIEQPIDKHAVSLRQLNNVTMTAETVQTPVGAKTLTSADLARLAATVQTPSKNPAGSLRDRTDLATTACTQEKPNTNEAAKHVEGRFPRSVFIQPINRTSTRKARETAESVSTWCRLPLASAWPCRPRSTQRSTSRSISPAATALPSCVYGGKATGWRSPRNSRSSRIHRSRRGPRANVGRLAARRRKSRQAPHHG